MQAQPTRVTHAVLSRAEWTRTGSSAKRGLGSSVSADREGNSGHVGGCLVSNGVGWSMKWQRGRSKQVYYGLHLAGNPVKREGEE